MKRLSYENFDWGHEGMNRAWRRQRQSNQAMLDRHGLAIGSRYLDAQRFTELDVRSLRRPPEGWSFVTAVSRLAPDEKPSLDEDQSREWRAFWAWYVPVESNLLQLCELLRTFAKLGNEHEAICRELRGMGHELVEHYRGWMRAEQLAWLPKRIGYQREKLHIIEFLGRHLIDLAPEEPPQWATEEAPMEMPF